MDVAKLVLRSEGGLRGLFKGMVPTLAREVPGNAVVFGPVSESVTSGVSSLNVLRWPKDGLCTLRSRVAGASVMSVSWDGGLSVTAVSFLAMTATLLA